MRPNFCLHSSGVPVHVIYLYQVLLPARSFLIPTSARQFSTNFWQSISVYLRPRNFAPTVLYTFADALAIPLTSRILRKFAVR